jgi:GTP pyrophosphokinase
VLDTLRAELKAAGVKADVAGRPKHIFSIWKKMKKKKLDFTELYDIRAVRILVDKLPDCYTALGIIHGMWQPIPGEFDDYISHPKANNYRSLHTAVIGPEDKALEVQIRTFEMHEHAEFGVAAHWRYKEGGKGDAQYEEKFPGCASCWTGARKCPTAKAWPKPSRPSCSPTPSMY